MAAGMETMLSKSLGVQPREVIAAGRKVAHSVAVAILM